MANSTQYGAFVPNTFIWDVQQLQGIDLNSPEFRELLVRLYQNLGLMCDVLNIKDTGMYQVTEFVNGQLFFSNPANTSATAAAPALRQVLRKVINFGALPNTATKSVAHGITVNTSTTFTRIYGAASDTTGFNYIPLPYASPTDANEIELSVDATNVNVTTGSNRTNFNITYIILEYIKS